MRLPDSLCPGWPVAKGAETEYWRAKDSETLDKNLQLWETLIADKALDRAHPHFRAGFLNAGNVLLMKRFQATFDRRDHRLANENRRELVDGIETGSDHPGVSHDPYRGVFLGTFGAALHVSFEIEPDLETLDGQTSG